jgi:GNAT superfamily N-acetyltransferase
MTRPALPEDGPQVFELARQLATSFDVEEGAFKRNWDALLKTENAAILVHEEEGVIEAYLLGYSHRTFYANGPVAWVEELLVAETQRGQGIGTLLMEEFEAWALAKKCRLVATATRRAAAFYQSLGYEESAAYFRKLLEEPEDPPEDRKAQRAERRAAGKPRPIP